MTRGKHATSADARRAREQSESEARRLEKANVRLEREVVDLVAQVTELKHQVAEGVSADLARVEKELDGTKAELRAARDVIHESEKAMRDAYEGTVRGLAKLGIPLTTAQDRADEVFKFLINGELLGPGDVMTTWDRGGKLYKLTKRPAHKMRALHAADRVDEARANDAANRQDEGIT